MSAYKPYKPVRIENRCPHGYDKRECGTCVNAKKEADAYWQRMRDIEAKFKQKNGYAEEKNT